MARLTDAVIPFIQATDADQVLETLDAVAGAAGVRAFAVCPRHLVKREEDIGEKVIFHPNVSIDLRADLKTEHKRGGPSIMDGYARQCPSPFTVTEAMRLLQPSGYDRWIFDLLRDHRIRDGFYCTHWPRTLFYSSDHVLKGAELSNEVRMALDMAAGMAISRMKEITARSMPPSPATLSSRERTVLLHLSDGLSVGEIADRLALSEPSVRTFVRRATKKLNASNQLHAVVLAVKIRLT